MRASGDEPHDLTIGDGRYVLLAMLGEGGMATVWRARHERLGVERAVKMLRPEWAAIDGHRSRFLAEARTMSRLRHPNVLEVFDCGEDDGQPWFAAELVEGGALASTLDRDGRLSPLDALDVTFQLLQALAAAHRLGVVHRDVKPENILRSADGRVRLSDFGIARIRDEAVEHRTRTGLTMGTLGYMAPEQRSDARSVGPRADLYAVGATLFALSTGSEPPELFASEVDGTQLEAVHPAIRDVIRRSTAYRAEQRYADARAMAVDVAAAYDAIALAKGSPAKAGEWMARFDALLLGHPVTPVSSDTPVSRVQSTLAPTLADPPPRSRRLVARMLFAAPIVGVASVLFGYFAWSWAIADARPCVGVWAGTRAGPLNTDVPMRVELADAGHGRVSGRVISAFMGNEVAVPLTGRCAAPTITLDESGDRPDRGRYTGTIAADTFAGAFTNAGGQPEPFSLRRTGATP